VYAALVTVSIDAAEADPAMVTLKEEIVPGVKAAPGFIAGYWMAPDESAHAISVVLFETEEQARQTAPPQGVTPSAGVIVTEVEFREVVVSA
jgi:hypothetical protein